MLGSGKDPTRVKSARRALDLIDLIAASGSMSFQEIVDTRLPKSSAHGLLSTLVESGWLERSATRRYTLGLRAWQVGQTYDGHRLLLEVADPILDRVVTELGETVQLARLDGIESVYIAIRLSPHPMRLASAVGMRLHAHATGIGKALLSTLEPAEARRRLESVVLPRLTDHTTTDVSQLMNRLDRAREVGFAVDDEEFIEGCRCVAVPITTEQETGIVSALSVTMPTQRTNHRWPHSLYPALRDAAVDIRRGMGLHGSLSP